MRCLLKTRHPFCSACFQIKIPLSLAFHLQFVCIQWVPPTYRHQCIVSWTTTHNDTLEKIGVEAEGSSFLHRKEDDDDNAFGKSSFFSFSSFSRCKCGIRMKNFITHSYCGIMNSFSDCFLLLCYYCLLESWCTRSVRASLSSPSLRPKVTKQHYWTYQP